MTLTLDYTALTESLNKADIEAYKQSDDYNIGAVKGIAILGGVFVAGALIFCFITFGFSEGFFWIPASPAIVVLLLYYAHFWFSFMSKVSPRARLHKFALRNSIQFKSEIYEPSYSDYRGAIFNDGYDNEIYETLQFKNGIEIGNFIYFTGSTKQSSLLRRKHKWGFVRFKLSKTLPHMLLDSKANNIWRFSNFRDSFDKSQILKLDENLDKHFTLYVSPHYEAVARQIFTPSTVSTFTELYAEYDFEIKDNELFIYSKGHFPLNNPALYEHIFAVIDLLGIDILDQIDHSFPEQVSYQTGAIIKSTSQPLKSRSNILRVAFSIIVIMIYIFVEFIYPYLMQ